MPKHITYLLIGLFCGLCVGIIAGWQLSNMAFKPLLKAEHNQKVFVSNENIRLQRYYKHFAIESEAHRQDLEVFKKESTLMKVLRDLGLDKYLED